MRPPGLFPVVVGAAGISRRHTSKITKSVRLAPTRVGLAPRLIRFVPVLLLVFVTWRTQPLTAAQRSGVFKMLAVGELVSTKSDTEELRKLSESHPEG